MRIWFMFALLLPTLAAAAAATPDPLSLLSGAERSYYRQIFSYVMETLKGGETYTWRGYESTGTISVSATFQSTAKSTCRKFSETINLGGVHHSAQGHACRRQRDEPYPGWCRLMHKEGPLTCAMEPPSSALGETLKEGGDLLEKGRGLLDSLGQ